MDTKIGCFMEPEVGARLALVQRARVAQRRDDGVTALAPVRERYPDFATFLSKEPEAGMIERLRGAENVGRPHGNRKFLDTIERKTQRVLEPAKRGPKPRGIKCA